MLHIKAFSFVSVLAFTACSAVYTSPSIKSNEGQVAVVEVDPQTIAFANKSAYRPKKLPAVFNRVSGTGPSKTTLTSLPNASLQQQDNYIKPQLSIPPSFQPAQYKLGVSDVILLATPTPQTSDALTGLIAAQNKRQGYTIQDDGAIAVPDIGRIELAGQTIKDAEATIFQKLIDNQIDPKFSLEIAEFKSKGASVGGAVNKSIVAPITLKPLTLQNALQNAGGIKTTTPEYTTIKILRDGKKYQIPLQDFETQQKLQNLFIKNGDSIIVENDFQEDRAQAYVQEQLALIEARSVALEKLQTEASLQRAKSNEARQNFLTKLELGAVKRDYVYLAGEVAKQGRFPLPFDNTASVADAIYSEGGVLSREGDIGQIYVLRASNNNPPITAYHLDASNAVNLLLAAKMQLRPDDVIFVAEQRVTAWNRVISQILPSLTIVDQLTN